MSAPVQGVSSAFRSVALYLTITGGSPGPALTPVFTFSPRAIVWLWFAPSIPPAFTFVLIFTEFFLSLRLIVASVATYLYRRKRNAKLLAGKTFLGFAQKYIPSRDRFSRSFSPVEVSSGHPRSRGYRDAAQRQQLKRSRYENQNERQSWPHLC